MRYNWACSAMTLWDREERENLSIAWPARIWMGMSAPDWTLALAYNETSDKLCLLETGSDTMLPAPLISGGGSVAAILVRGGQCAILNFKHISSERCFTLYFLSPSYCYLMLYALCILTPWQPLIQEDPYLFKPCRWLTDDLDFLNALNLLHWIEPIIANYKYMQPSQWVFVELFVLMWILSFILSYIFNLY